MEDLSLPENNEQIPQGDPLSPEDRTNPLIPEDSKSSAPAGNASSILKQLENSENAKVGNIMVQRRYKHDGEAGGEDFTLTNIDTGEEVEGIQLSELAKVKDEAELKTFFTKK